MGQLYATQNALQLLNPAEIADAVQRHCRGDWGDICQEDRGLNEEALTDGSRIMSIYQAKQGIRFWIITEADRSVTTVLLPEDY